MLVDILYDQICEWVGEVHPRFLVQRHFDIIYLHDGDHYVSITVPSGDLVVSRFESYSRQFWLGDPCSLDLLRVHVRRVVSILFRYDSSSKAYELVSLYG